MNTASLIKLFEYLTVEKMRRLTRELDPTGQVAKTVPNRPSVEEMARATVDGLNRLDLVNEALFDKLAETLVTHSDEVERVRNLWEIQWQAAVVVQTAREDVESTAQDLVERAHRQLKETEEALAIAVQHASQRARELNETVERASATERALETLRAQADGLLAGIRTHEREAEEILAGLRELSPAELEIRERKREQEPDLFDTGEVRRPKMNGLLWPVGATLTVGFIGGTAEQRSLTREAAERWAKHANVRFEFTDEGEAMVRISFDPARGSWAYVGTNALGIAADLPTMNLAWVDKMPESALHEFGHVLGLIHEWQNPNSDIKWNVEAVKAKWRHMSDEQIGKTLTDRASDEDYPDYRDFDPSSIMMFPIPATWLLEGRGFTPSKTLTESDKALIRRLYPYQEDTQK